MDDLRTADVKRSGVTRLGGTTGRRIRAFSLIEVVFSLGIAAFALVILIGLLPVGLQANRESRQEGFAINLVNALIADLKSSPKSAKSVLYQLPPLSDSANSNAQGLQAAAISTNAFSESLQLLSSLSDAKARYQVVVTRQSVYTNSLNPVIYTFVVNPLPRAANNAGPGILETTIAIPCN